MFSFTTSGGPVNLTFNPNAFYPTLDILATLYDNNGTAITTSDPSDLNAGISTTLAAGNYYVSVTGTGSGNPATTGYSNYASLGNYSITGLLKTIVGKEEYFEQYLFDQHFAHHGWSGFVSAVEDNPQTLLDNKKISFKELVEFELLMELDALHHALGNKWQPLATHVTVLPVDLLADVPKTEFAEVIELWQDAFEWSYYDSVLKGILLASPANFVPSLSGTSKGGASESAMTKDFLFSGIANPLASRETTSPRISLYEGMLTFLPLTKTCLWETN
jgi:hypothetical protein